LDKFLRKISTKLSKPSRAKIIDRGKMRKKRRSSMSLSQTNLPRITGELTTRRRRRKARPRQCKMKYRRARRPKRAKAKVISRRTRSMPNFSGT